MKSAVMLLAVGICAVRPAARVWRTRLLAIGRCPRVALISPRGCDCPTHGPFTHARLSPVALPQKADARVLLQGQGQGQVSKTEPSLNNGQIMQLYAANAAQVRAQRAACCPGVP